MSINNQFCLKLFQCTGKVHDPADFIASHSDYYSTFEQSFVTRCIHHLNQKLKIPAQLRVPWIAAEWMKKNAIPTIEALPSGQRSAFWKEQRIKFKGCRPPQFARDFPLETLPFGATRISKKRIPFGIMTLEAILRELLGYLFFKEHELPISDTPLCIYEYINQGQCVGYCLVLETLQEGRLEALLDYPHTKVADLFQTLLDEDPIDSKRLMGSEINLKNVNLWSYVEQKSDLLSRMHFHGGFRGPLNSNIGNDVITVESKDSIQLSLCDFDTFKIIELQDCPTRDFLNAFALQCTIEVVMGSIPISEYVLLEVGSSTVEKAKRIGKVYTKKSSLWRAYWRQAHFHAGIIDWNISMLDDAVEKALESSAFLEASCSCILSSHCLEQHGRPDRERYVPHGK